MGRVRNTETYPHGSRQPECIPKGNPKNILFNIFWKSNHYSGIIMLFIKL